MGAWGTSLYANDFASDIRGEYLDRLRRGKTNKEATQELIEANKAIMGNFEEEPLFWYALADTQWNYGRLLPFVKEKALSFIDKKEELERWRDADETQMLAWENTRQKLKETLLSPQPPEKKVSKYRLYQCPWNFGDVFAYQFSSAYSQEKHFCGKYVFFRKVSENIYWPGHVVPVVQVYNWVGETIPPVEFFKDMKLLPLNCSPTTLLYKPNIKKEYVIQLVTTSQRVIPKESLSFLGNISDEVPSEFLEYAYSTGPIDIDWKINGRSRSFERYIIEKYLDWVGCEA